MNCDFALLLKAASFAAEKHRNQLRKGEERTPYINHPLEVARILAEEGAVSDPEIIAAALLHDTIEDTKTTESELAAIFGDRVASIVAEVTDDKSITDKAERKRLQITNSPSKSPSAALVKLADKIANVRDVGARPAQGWSKAQRIEYIEWATSVITALPIKHQLRDIFNAAASGAKEMIHQAQESVKAHEQTVDGNDVGSNARYPLVKILLVFVFLIPTIWYAINFLAYPPSAPTASGIALVLSGYYGSALAMSILFFMPVMIYRGYLRLKSKQYSKDTELLLLVAGGVLTLWNLKGQGII